MTYTDTGIDARGVTPAPQTKTDPDPGRPWLCKPGGHVLGVVVRIGGVKRLALYRQAVRVGEPGQVLAYASGSVDQVKCSICGRSRSWHIGADGIRQLLETIGRRQVPR